MLRFYLRELPLYPNVYFTLDTADDYLRSLDLLLLQHTSPSAATAIAFVAVFLLLMCSALVSGSEVAYFSLSDRIQHQLAQSSHPADQRIHRLLDKPGLLLATILIANNFINIAIIILSSFALDAVIPQVGLSFAARFVIEVGLVTAFLVLFGEVAPKIYASINNLQLARLMSAPMLRLRQILYPFSLLLNTSTSYIERRLSRQKDQEEGMSIEELDQAIDLTVSSELDAEQEVGILKNILRLNQYSVKRIMKARRDVTAIAAEASFGELLELARESNYSRIPIYEETLDNITGVIYIKDLVKHLQEPYDTFAWQQLKREPYFVPETQRLGTLLQKLKTKRVHIAIVIDEHGMMAGIVTLEDILEEVMGSILDEFDDEASEAMHRVIGEGHYSFKGSTPINDLCRVLEVSPNEFEETRGDTDTLAGMILEIKRDFPKKGEELQVGHYLFKVVSTTATRIERIEVKVLPIEEEDADPS